MWVSLSQDTESGESCRISLDLSSYVYMSEMTKELKRGMTPIVSYWADDDMLWLDGRGDDHKGQCKQDNKTKCADYVRFYDFSIAEISDEDWPIPSKNPTTQKPASDTGTTKAWWEQPSSSTAQAVGSLGWDSGKGGGDWQAPDPSASDRGDVVEGGKCVEFDNWRKAAVGGRAVQINLGKKAYGAQTSWLECRSMCAKDKSCKQVLFYKPDGSCFGTKEALGYDQDHIGGSNYDFISAHCNNACAEFNNWRKSEEGEEIPLGKYEYGAVAEDWPTCRDRCAAEKECKQVVYYRPERKCFGMSERGDDDQDNMGGNNPDFVSAHCQKVDAATSSGDGSPLDELGGTKLGGRWHGEHIVMQKKHTRFLGPGWLSDDSRWAFACGSLAFIAVLIVCGVVAVGAKRRRNLHAAGLRRFASLAEKVDSGHGLMRTKPSSERLLEIGGGTLAPPSLPRGSAVEMQHRFL